MSRWLSSTRFAFVGLLVMSGACAQIEGLSGLKYDSGSGGGATSANGGSAHGGSGPTGSGGSASGAGGPGGGGTGGSDACGPNAACVDVPSGWNGPVILFPTADATSTCAAPYAVVAVDGGSTPAQEDVSCKPCTCDATPCGAFKLDAHITSDCSNLIASFDVPAASACNSTGQIAAQSLVLTLTPGLGPCGAGGGDVKTRSTPSFVDRVLACAPSNVGASCGAGVCAPEVHGHGACVYQAGDLAKCPVAFSQRTLVYTSIHDGRGCAGCSCGAATGACTGYIDIYTDGNCMSPLESLSPTGTCDGGAQFASVMPFVQSPCAATGGNPGGTLSGQMPVTVCCE